jgi:hypothetical protein
VGRSTGHIYQYVLEVCEEERLLLIFLPYATVILQ